jgi:outer membrane immunogenic protein
MQRFLLGAAAALAMAGSAIAADMPVKAPPVKAPPLPVQGYNWTGCYVAGGGGYGMFNQDIRENGLQDTIGGRGWFGTVGGGCDLQLGGSWVVGAFGDYDFSGLKGNLILPGNGDTGRDKEKSAWAVGGRLGYTLTPAILAYINAGYTQARFGNVALFDGAVPDGSIASHTYTGWFLGGGYEYRLNFVPGLFWRTEYRFAQYGRDNLAILDGVGAPTGATISSDKTVQTIRSELVWRFNWGGRY